MQAHSTIDLEAARLRFGARFRLASYDELTDAERAQLASLSDEPDFYGILLPPAQSALPIKSVSHHAALLFHRLREPARVPHLLRSLFGAQAHDHLEQLILDGILEIERDGAFVSGAAALRTTATPGGTSSAESLIARLSADAIRYAAELPDLSVQQIATRLYMYNRAPATPALRRQIADPASLLAFLGGDPLAAGRLGAHWIGETSRKAWYVWRTADSEAALAYKLYISPDIAALPEVFGPVVDALLAAGCTQFKVGLDAYGLLRPDKLVAYFDRLDQIQRAAELIRAACPRAAAQGVPFTAAIGDDGLLSWGMDPPRFEQLLGAQSARSWREWITNRLAVYIVAARESGAGDVADFVLHRLTIDGVDTTTWTPSAAIWRRLGGFSEELA